MAVKKAKVDALGFVEGARVTHADDPRQFVVIGDVGETEDEIRAAYAGNAWVQEVIGALLDRHRTWQEPPPEFVASCRNGVKSPAHYVLLGEDNDGKDRAALIDGRQRWISLNIHNDARVEMVPPKPLLPLDGIRVLLPMGNAAEAARIVREWKNDGNATVPMSRASIAERVQEALRENVNSSNEAVAAAVYLRASDAHEVPKYAAFALLVLEIQRAEEVGDIKWSEVPAERLAKLGAAAQREWLENKMAPTAEKKTRGYAPPATFVSAAARHFATGKRKDLAAVLNWLAAPTQAAFDVLDKDIREGFEVCGLNVATQRIKRATQ